MIVRLTKQWQQYICILACFLLFVPSYYSNFWGIANEDLGFVYLQAEGDISNIKEYDPYPTLLVISRLAESKRSGVLSYAGLPGMNFDKEATSDSIINNMYQEAARHTIWYKNIVPVYLDYFNDKEPAPDFCPYTSQVGVQIMVYGLINNVLPFDNKTNYAFLKLLNAVLVSLAFVIFLGWVYRNFGLPASSVTFILLLITPWLVLFGGSLWWSIWGLYIPFLAVLLIMERRYKQIDKVSDNLIFLVVFMAVSLKCLFTGMEFITSALMGIYCPVVYYFWQEKQKMKTFIIFSFKIGLSALLAVFVNLVILFFQIKSVMGGFSAAIGYIEYAFVRRTSFVDYKVPDNIFEIVLKQYLKEDAFNWGIFQSPYTIRYVYLVFIVFLLCAFLFFYFRKITDKRKYVSLSLATLFSFLSSLSWYYIFVQHAHQHPCYDNMVWYMPFMLYGYVVLGVGFALLFDKVKNIIFKT